MTALPDLNDEARVPQDRVDEFRTRGHTRIDALATPEEIEAVRPGLLAAAQKGRFDHRPLEERGVYGKAFIQMFNVWTHGAAARAFVFARRFARVAADLMGVVGVRLYHDQALFKEPGGGPTPWHQDQFYWPLDTSRTITMWMPLVEVTPDMGPMVFASGSHALGHLGDFGIGAESERHFEALVAERGLPVSSCDRLAPGDATFHAGWTLHRASANTSDRMREVMTVIYFADGARVSALDHPNRRFDRDAWLPGCEPGGFAASELNPVLYAR